MVFLTTRCHVFLNAFTLCRVQMGKKKAAVWGWRFVSEVARLFNGEVTLRNVQEGGVLASLRLHRHFT